MNDFNVAKFIDSEVEDGTPFEEILERFDLTPGEVFQMLYDTGQIDPDVLDSYILDI